MSGRRFGGVKRQPEIRLRSQARWGGGGGGDRILPAATLNLNNFFNT